MPHHDPDDDQELDRTAKPVLDLAVPVYVGPGDDRPVASVGVRVLAFILAAGCLTVLLTAARLKPSHLGYGSHTDLGLQRCEFMARTGLPCPSCGMTTSFTWFVRGNLLASLYVQPMGTVVAVLAAVTVWIGFYVALTGRPVYRLLRVVPARYYYLPLFVLAILGWAWKIIIHVNHLDGW